MGDGEEHHYFSQTLELVGKKSLPFIIRSDIFYEIMAYSYRGQNCMMDRALFSSGMLVLRLCPFISCFSFGLSNTLTFQIKYNFSQW